MYAKVERSRRTGEHHHTPTSDMTTSTNKIHEAKDDVDAVEEELLGGARDARFSRMIGICKIDQNSVSVYDRSKRVRFVR